METINVAEQDSSEVQKKEVNRSAAYPLFSIEEAINFEKSLYTSYTLSFIKREDADAVNELGYTNRYLASCVQYGLLNREKDGYKVSELFIKIHKHIDENERRESLIQAFGNPKLYKQLIQIYDGHAIPAELATILFRKHDIAEKASTEAAKIFIDNGKYVGAIDEKNILRVASAKERVSTTQYAEVITEPAGDNGNARQELITKNQPLLYTPVHQAAGAESEIINLPGSSKATLTFPSDITLKGVALIRKRLDEIEFRIKEEGTA